MGHEINLEQKTRAMLATGERHVEEDDHGGRPHVRRARRRRPGKRPSRSGLLWTRQEDKVLTLEWGEISARELMRKLKGRSWLAITYHAVYELGLPRGFPQGSVSCTCAARRLGFSSSITVRRLAARQRVTVVLHPRPATVGPKRMPRRCVDWYEILDAFLRENATESVRSAAHRRDLNEPTLWRWLRAEGVIAPRQVGMRQRVATADIDRVVAARRGQS